MIPSAANIIFFTFSLCLYSHYCTAADSLKVGAKIRNNGSDSLVSPGNYFEMGFFSPGKNSDGIKKYLGIWYTMDTTTVVWVANRENPVSGNTAVLTVSEDGNLLLEEQETAFMNLSNLTSSSRTLKLLDNGNIQLIDDRSNTCSWQSFDSPTDTFLFGMKMDQNFKLTSWKSQYDPGLGTYTFQRVFDKENSYEISKGSATPHWKVEGGSSSNFEGSQMYDRAISLININGSTTGNRTNLNNSRLFMNCSGEIQFLSWNDTGKNWDLFWREPKDGCAVYSVCGKYGSCMYNPPKISTCKCLEGFQPEEPENWRSGHFGDGCMRPTKCGKQDKFLNLTILKVKNPDNPAESESEDECKDKCLLDCNCQAFSFSSGSNRGISGNNQFINRSRDPTTIDRAVCWIWTSDLLNLQEDSSGHKLYVRVSNSKGSTIDIPSEGSSDDKQSEGFKLSLILVIVIATLLLLFLFNISYISYKRMITRRESIESNQRNIVLQLDDTERRIRELLDPDDSRECEMDMPFFDLESIIAATNDFSDENKLGQGGFGPVYKGKLPGGLEIAVKRLSNLSGQGLEEFKTEVVLIAKLQHRNLVRLLGYCMKGEEKMLLYEYMPNKSLDAFIFDQVLRISLDWNMRFNIIMGIARGLLYLHQDSRLRIIHRDLKTSNILLDEDMNPKISDFGLAKIVKGKDMEASTNRVIGTYGYMSPEYALDGLFSVKSDVFSFGVVMLEIVSGKRNTGFYQSQKTRSLLGHAWNLWMEDKPFELMDQVLLESCNSSEVLKCIIIGLLCVQEDPNDRPTMTNVVLMLGGDIASLPNPKQPAFISRKLLTGSSSSSSSKPETQTNNMITITQVEGR